MEQHSLPLPVPVASPRVLPEPGTGVRIWQTIPRPAWSPGGNDIKVSDGTLVAILPKGVMPFERLIELGAFSTRSRASKYDRWVVDCILFNGYRPKRPAYRVFPMDHLHKWERLIYCETLTTNQVRALKSEFPLGGTK